jgi:anti-sigma regulatory factor (Ser/Thr protein kinase)
MSTAAELFTATLPADPGVLKDFRRRLTSWLEAAGVKEERDAILLAAHEAAANAIEHAAAPVTVVGRVEPDVILIEVTSAGRWAAHRQEPSDERGRGVALMRGLLSDVQILAEEERTIVRLRMIRSQAPD